MGTEMKEMRGVECKFEGKDCYVVHADREIGITLHYIDDDTQAACLNKKEILLNAKRYKSRFINRVYHELFSKIIDDINNGEIFSYGIVFSFKDDAYVEVWDEEGLEEFNNFAFTCAYLK
jgi:hypothetical protein